MGAYKNNLTQIQKADRNHYSDRLSATLRFDAPVSVVSQVSPKRACALEARGITRVRDLLNQFPRRYLDMSQVVSIGQANISSSCTIVGRVYELKTKKPRKNLSIIEITLVDETGTLIVTCFNQPWLANQLEQNKRISVSGTVEFNYGFKRMTNPVITQLEDDEVVQGLVRPFHSTLNQLSPALVKRMISHALDAVRGLYDPLPLSLRKKYRLCSRFQAYKAIHFPDSLDDISMAHRRLLYEELFFLEMQLLKDEKARIEKHAPFVHRSDASLQASIEHLLPFSLSADQARAVKTIFEDMQAKRSMNRLLLGDVGSGKTIVSLFGLVASALSGYQAVMVGPTEILVQQYARALGVYLDKFEISWAILSGTTPSDKKMHILESLKEGSLQVCFGTHALFEKTVTFKNCSFVCFDEQQRFGVDQRNALLEKAPGADILSMTATPIPRSLALALYGTMALSYLHQTPARFAKRTTKVISFAEEGLAYDALRLAIDRGEQAYVVCPLIGIPTQELEDKSEEENTQVEYALVELSLETDSQNLSNEKRVKDNLQTHVSAAKQHAEILQNQIFPEARVALLHGKMSPDEKTATMQAFVAGEIDILVSTTIVEVGVDVPNATTMIIEDADRFGLAQLHQLRGRVGRGEKPGQVFLVSRSKSPAAAKRLQAMEVTEDGFKLSEMDLAQRQEGDVLGARQHGRNALRLVNVMRDGAVIEAAYTDAYNIVFNNVLSASESALLNQELQMIAHE